MATTLPNTSTNKRLKKRLIVCCDGTRQSQNNDCPTNVLKIAQAVKPIAKDKITIIT